MRRQKAKFFRLGHDGANFECVVALRHYGVEDGETAFDKERECRSEIAVDELNDAAAALETGASIGDKKLHHRAEISIEAAGFQFGRW